MKSNQKKKFSSIGDLRFSLFCTTHQAFQIPIFQRTYNWKNKQINELWDSITENDLGYFLGSLVCLDPSEETGNKLLIIDGQQRLTTISLFLLNILEVFKDLRTQVKDKIEREDIDAWIKDVLEPMLYYKDTNEMPPKQCLKLIPGKDTLVDVYEKLIKGEIDPNNTKQIMGFDDSQRKYIKNYRNTKSLVRQYIKDEKTSTKQIEKLKQLIKKIHDLIFIVIVCTSDSDAYQVFEGLNATGLGLSVADLVKNSVMQKMKGSIDRERLEEKWNELEAKFEKKSSSSVFTKFLRHHWISRDGYISTKDLYDSIKEKRIKNKDNKAVIQFVSELCADAEAYIAFRFEDNAASLNKKLSESIREIIGRFKLLDSEQIYEVLLALYNKYIENNSTYTEKQFIKDLESLWCFCFKVRILSINPSEYENHFADYCVTVKEFKKKEKDRMSLDLLKVLRKIVANKDQVFVHNFAMDLEYVVGGDNELIKHVLGTLFLNCTPGITVHGPSIEHILPQDPTKWNLSKKDIESYVHKIGNLTLLNGGENQSLSNDAMKEKCAKSFDKSVFKLNKDLCLLENDFTLKPNETINKRGRQLAELANKIWVI